MEVARIEAKPREGRGRRQTRLTRAEGMIPGVLYGLGRENMCLCVPQKQFTELVTTHHKLFEVEFEGGKLEEAYLQDIQWDVLDDSILHVDFLRIDLSATMHTTVEIAYVGQPKGLAKDGVFETVRTALEIECLPADLPDSVRANVNDLDIGDAIHVGDLKLPDGVRSLLEDSTLLCHVKLKHESLDVDEEEAPAEGATAEPEVIGKAKDEGEGSPKD